MFVVQTRVDGKHLKLVCLLFLLNLFGVVHSQTEKLQFKFGDRSQRMETSVFAVVSFSYDKTISRNISIGLLGTAFLVDSNKVATANHVIPGPNREDLIPLKKSQYYLLRRGSNLAIPFNDGQIERIPKEDLAFINVGDAIQDGIPIEMISIEDEALRLVRSYGHQIGEIPISYHWKGDTLKVDEYDLQYVKSDAVGYITRSEISNINIPGLGLSDVSILELSIKGTIGYSGGPVLYRGSGELLGIMSFMRTDHNENQYVIHVNEIIDRFRKPAKK